MIECPSCGRKRRLGTLFCSECGAYLPAEGAGVIAIVPLCLKVVPTGRQVQLPTVDEILVGCLDASQGIFPDLDLTPDGGLEGGVSHQHCKIHRQESVYLVEDIGSANGTFLNGQRLPPYLPHTLSDGDELELGGMALQVIIRD